MPQFNDSTDKIISSYFSVVNLTLFNYKNQEWKVKPLTVSPSLLRDTICPANCGACCSKFSLDWIPTEQRPEHPEMKERKVSFNGKEKIIYTIFPHERKSTADYHCMLVDKNGRCQIHGKHPFSCDFELIRPMHYKEKNVLLTKLYGRCWNLLKVDGTRKGLCQVTPISDTGKSEARRKLLRLQEWCEYFEIPTKISKIIEWIDSDNTDHSIIL
jgi:Fe-S-cluster containining protein